MAEPRRTEAKNFIQDRPGGYFTPKGIDRQAERHDAIRAEIEAQRLVPAEKPINFDD
jgi:hypothetical protein